MMDRTVSYKEEMLQTILHTGLQWWYKHPLWWCKYWQELAERC